MKRRTFLQASLFPALTYAVLRPSVVALVEGTIPAKFAATHTPTVKAIVDGWPMWQYGDHISADHPLSEEEIIDYKLLCHEQAKETFAYLQVPDACDKIEYIVQQAGDDGDKWAQRGYIEWRVTIPAPAWQWVLSEHPDKSGMLKQVLKTRKRIIPISLNSTMQMIPRSYVRDYLRLVVK